MTPNHRLGVWITRGFLTFSLAIASMAEEKNLFPDTHWQRATPSSQALDPTRLSQAVTYLKDHSGSDGVDELLIIRNGRIVWEGPHVNKVHGIWSGTKSFTSTCLGLLIDQGRCQLDTKAAEIDPSLSRHYPDVTLRHFTTMTSGYRAQGDEPRGSYSHGPSQTPFNPSPSPLFKPGTHYAYWDSAMNQFAHLLTRLAQTSLEQYFEARIAKPIGMHSERWRWGHFDLDSQEYPINGGAGNSSKNIFIAATELARLGLLFLNEGRWKDQQLISAHWIDQATSVQVPAIRPLGHSSSGIAGPGSYGFNWWRNGRLPDGTRKWPGAPDSTFAASGFNNNDLFVIPDWNMVIVRLGLDERDHKITDPEYGQFLQLVGDAITDTTRSGEHKVWHPLTLTFRGPYATETDSNPNPFLDARLSVNFTSPSGKIWRVPGFFAGDGRGHDGNLWQVRFSPDQPGRWTYLASFREAPQIAINLDPDVGEPGIIDGQSGHFDITPSDRSAPGFLPQGRLEYVGKHYLKFRDGSYWIRGGTDSPENFLAYSGFDNTPPHHHYRSHELDWLPGDPDWGDGKGKAIIGALNSLASLGANSLYFLVMNIGGDGGDVWPWAGTPNPKGSPQNDNTHYDLSKLLQWDTVFEHAQRNNLFLHFVFNEAERQNKAELDGGDLGVERKLYYRELIARFGHHLALQWNLCEEYNLQLDFGPERIRSFAKYIQSVDPYQHPITVHSSGDPEEQLAFTIGDSHFNMMSVQLNQRRIDTLVERLRQRTIQADRPIPISMDEFTLDLGQEKSWIPFDRPALHRKTKLWPTYFSGGMIEFILEGLLDVDSFKTPARKALWRDIATARRFMENHLPFWEMHPADDRVIGELTLTVGNGNGSSFELGAQVFEKPGSVMAIYYPTASQPGRIDLSSFKGRLELRWFNPRTDQFDTDSVRLTGGFPYSPSRPSHDPSEDWVALITLDR